VVNERGRVAVHCGTGSQNGLPRILIIGPDIHYQHLQKISTVADGDGLPTTNPISRPHILWVSHKSAPKEAATAWWPIALKFGKPSHRSRLKKAIGYEHERRLCGLYTHHTSKSGPEKFVRQNIRPLGISQELHNVVAAIVTFTEDAA